MGMVTMTTASRPLSGVPSKARSKAPAKSSYQTLLGRFDLPGVWRAAIAVYSRDALPIVLFTLLGLAGAFIVILTTSAAARVVTDAVNLGHRQGHDVLRSLQGVFQTGLFWTETLWMLAGTIVLAFARGAIAHIALQSDDVSLIATVRISLKRLPELFFSICLYGVLATIAAAGLWLLVAHTHINVPTRSGFSGAQKYLDVYLRAELNNAADAFMTQGSLEIVSDKEAPFVAWMPLLGNIVWTRDTPGTNRGSVYIASHYPETRQDLLFTSTDPEFWWIATSSLALLTTVELSLRFRTVAAIAPGATNPFRVALIGVRLALRQAVPLALHVSVFRLATLVFSLLFVILPSVLAQSLLLPRLHLVIADWVPWHSLHTVIVQLTLLGAAAAQACISAFGVVYDARLWSLLTSTSISHQQRSEIANRLSSDTTRAG